MAYDFKGKIALITGGAQGIGFAIVKELLRNGIQAVTIADINAEKGAEAVEELNREFGLNRAIFVKTDVTTSNQLEAAFKATIGTWNGLDIVVNNAGIGKESQWELEISVNCNAVVQGSLLALQYMGKDKGGKGGVLVNIASVFGLQSFSACPTYVGTKHFVIGFSRSLGTPYHYNRTGVKIVTMCPGVTKTPLVEEADKFLFTALGPDIGEQLVKDLLPLPSQPAENVAHGVITLITTGENGSVWVSEGNQPVYEVAIPDRLTLRKS